MTPRTYARARRERGSQTAVAAKLGVSRITIARRERAGASIPREAALALLALPPSRP